MPKRREWLQSENKRIIFHYTPFHGSWLNMVEIWFGILNQKCLKESMYNAIDDFINEWNTLLAHPFKWNYDGSGLCQKVVQRFLRMLENSTEKMNVTFMTKQLFLMTNMIKTCWDKVELEIWLKLDNAIAAKVEQMKEIISKDNGSKKKKKAGNALIEFIDTLRLRIDCTHKKVA